jgi:eukaryotic-like serine/threonine-protein kinase
VLRLALFLSAAALGSGRGEVPVSGAEAPAAGALAPEAGCAAPEPGFLTLDTAPWTQVWIDGAYAGSTPLFKHRLTPGEHTLTLVNESAAVRAEEVVTVGEAHVRKLKLILSADDSAAALDASGATSVATEDCFLPDDQAAALTVDTQPWSRVYVDGRLVGSTPLFKVPVAAGDHVVRLVQPDGSAAFARFSASAGEIVKLSFALR